MEAFYPGLHQPSDAQHFERCMVSVARLRDRKSDFKVNEWMMDSGAFMELKLFGRYRDSVATYAAQIARWARCGRLVAAVAQDYMCEPFMLRRTAFVEGLIRPTRRQIVDYVLKHFSLRDDPEEWLSITEITPEIELAACPPLTKAQTAERIATHQRLTIARYDTLHLLAADSGVYILPVLQGYRPSEYVDHIRQYGRRLAHGAWVGVGSVCKRNGDPEAIKAVLYAIKTERPDLRLHGFGIKRTALSSAVVRNFLHTTDSLAWSFAARYEGRDANDWHEAEAYSRKVAGRYDDLPMFMEAA